MVCMFAADDYRKISASGPATPSIGMSYIDNREVFGRTNDALTKKLNSRDRGLLKISEEMFLQNASSWKRKEKG